MPNVQDFFRRSKQPGDGFIVTVSIRELGNGSSNGLSNILKFFDKPP